MSSGGTTKTLRCLSTEVMETERWKGRLNKVLVLVVAFCGTNLVDREERINGILQRFDISNVCKVSVEDKVTFFIDIGQLKRVHPLKVDEPGASSLQEQCLNDSEDNVSNNLASVSLSVRTVV